MDGPQLAKAARGGQCLRVLFVDKTDVETRAVIVSWACSSFPVFDLGIGHLFPSEPEERKQK